MTKTQLLNQFAQSPEQRTLFASALDKADQAQQRQSPTASAFFTPEEQVQFSALLQHSGNIPHLFFGGYPQAQRKLCYFPPPWQDLDQIAPSTLPLRVVQATFKGELSHRDILGSLMGLGLTRGKFGDLLLSPNLCQVMVAEDTLPILLSQWSTAGRYPLSLVQIPLEELEVSPQQTKEITSTLSTLRLDSLVATGFSLSRSKAAALIAGGKVSLNHQDCQKPDKSVAEGDILDCRGLGKCLLTQVKGQSKKGRTIVTLERYL